MKLQELKTYISICHLNTGISIDGPQNKIRHRHTVRSVVKERKTCTKICQSARLQVSFLFSEIVTKKVVVVLEYT